MLVWIDDIVVGRVIEKQETDTARETGKAGTNLAQFGIAWPGKDKQADWNKPTGGHHRYQSYILRHDISLRVFDSDCLLSERKMQQWSLRHRQE